jgi:hypothetical protein
MPGAEAIHLPLVIQLQLAAMDARATVQSVLLKAKVVAAKLGLKDDELALWIEDELNGYADSPRDLASYRIIPVQPIAHNPYVGEIPVQIGANPDPALYRALHELPMTQSIAEIEELASRPSGNLRADFPPTLASIINEMASATFPLRWKFGPSQLRGILEAVRQRTLTWALELEAGGVVGEGFSFTLQEKAAAVSITNHFNNSNVGNAGAVSDGGVVNSVQHVHSEGLDLASVLELVGQIRANLSALPLSAQDAVKSEVSLIESEAASSNPSDGKIVAALKSIKATCEGAAGNLVASGVVTGIGALFGS